MTQGTNGNEENLAKVRAMMAQAQQANLAGDLTEGVPLDYVTVFGNELKGFVVFKRPTMKDYMKMGALKSEELRKAGVKDINLVDSSIKFMAHVLSTLRVVIAKAPEWLINLDAIQEPDILYYVYGKYEEWENSFRKPRGTDEAGDGDSEPTDGA